MDGLNKNNCAYSLDGTCRLDASHCNNCKIDKATSEFHKTLILGLTWDELMKMQQRSKT